MIDLIKPDDVAFIFNNEDGKTSTVGINKMERVIEKDPLGRKKVVDKNVVYRREMPMREANVLAKAVAAHKKLLDKFERENGMIQQTPGEKKLDGKIQGS